MTSPAEDDADPWHAGERALQRMLGVQDRMTQLGRRVIRDHMPEQHRTFFAQLPFVVLGSVDARGEVWATVLTGTPGFLSTPDAHTLAFGRMPPSGDPARAGIRPGSAVAVLGIELHTRRRNRMNGAVTAAGPEGFVVAVEHSFGNCPQYIQKRMVTPMGNPEGPHAGMVEHLDQLDETALAQVRAADTFFVASYVDGAGPPPHRQVDVSHRGGKPGFVRVDAEGLFTIPDFAGNRFFNTLGNFLTNPRAGLVFPDFARGDLLQLTGETALILDVPPIDEFLGAERLWTFRPTRIVRRRRALPLQFAFMEYSQNVLVTGAWRDGVSPPEDSR